MPLIPAWLALAVFIFITYPDNFIFTRWSLPTSEAKCLRLSPSAANISAEAIVKGYKKPCISDEMKDKKGVGNVGSEHGSMISEFETVWAL
jgi:hypothetical protein